MGIGTGSVSCCWELEGGDVGCLQMRSFEYGLLSILQTDQIVKKILYASNWSMCSEDDRISHDKAVHCGVPGQSGKFKKTTSIFRTGRETDVKRFNPSKNSALSARLNMRRRKPKSRSFSAWMGARLNTAWSSAFVLLYCFLKLYHRPSATASGQHRHLQREITYGTDRKQDGWRGSKN